MRAPADQPEYRRGLVYDESGLLVGEQRGAWSQEVKDYLLEWRQFRAQFPFGDALSFRLERVKRGSELGYWYAYRRIHGRLFKRYCCEGSDISPAQIERMPGRFPAEDAQRLAGGQ